MGVDFDSLLLKAKIEIMTRSAFISTIVLSVKHVITTDVPTAGTDDTVVMYNPDFIKTLSPAEMAGLMAHECWHIAYQHIARRGNRDPIQWNIAGDHVINLALLKGGFSLPEGGVHDPKYTDWSTDEVYDDIYEKDLPPLPDNYILDITGDNSGEEESSVVDIIVRAHTQALIASEGETIGEIPNEILRVIDKLLNPKIPWPVVLNRFLDARVKEDYSWARRNRRFTPYLPSLHSYSLGHLTFAIDTSGSQSDEELMQILSEIQGIQQVFNPQKMTILDCDSSIHNIYEIDGSTDILSLSFTGGGGTRFKPVLDYVTEHPVQALVYFTDLYGESTLEEVEYPVLWVCNSSHVPASIGETVYIDP